MAGTWTTERYPQFEQAIRRLTDQHREFEDEPLHLALSYQPRERNQQDVYLFEVIGGMESVSLERDLFETTFAGSTDFPLPRDQELHLILTNSTELATALRERWPLALEVVEAVRAGDFEILYHDALGEEILGSLRTAAERQGEPLG